MKETFISKKFRKLSLDLIDHANDIIRDYMSMGYKLTLRQLYYQFVARDLLPKEWADKSTGSTNNQKSYNNLGNLISDARLAGLIDWNVLEDRTRNLRDLSHWNNPKEIAEACAQQYRVDKWDNQRIRPTVWIEKDALVGVIEDACIKYDVSFLSTRGYISQSELYEASKRFINYYRRLGQKTILIHLSDHDPSGIDMSRDLEERLRLFLSFYPSDRIIELHRIALTMDQVEQYSPPPNPAKVTDSRFASYSAKYGDESWELDALDPPVITSLIEDEILIYQDPTLWEDRVTEENEGKDKLTKILDYL